jgi:hypothetical protein
VKSFHKIILALAVLSPARLFACAACYANGANINDPMVDGMNWAILTLGVVVATVLATFLTYFIYIMRKSEMLEAAAQQKSLENRSKLGGSQGDAAQTEENMEPACVGCYKMGIDSPEPAKV